MHFHKPQVKPSRWGSFADVQYAIRVNSEKIYGCDPEDDVLVMPLFWGLPPLDYSGYNNHGTNHGATYKDGSLDFDGSDDCVDVNDSASLDISGAIAISAWIYMHSAGSYPSIVVKREGSNNHAYCFEFFSTYRNINLYLEGANIGWSNRANTAVSLNVRTRIDAVYDGVDNLTYYYNGAPDGSYTVAGGDILVNDAPVSIGKRADGYAYDGFIDEVRISKAARTADQIALFYDNKYGLYQKVSRPIWSIPSGLTLTIAAIDGAGLLDNVVLTQKHNLTVQELSGAGGLDNVSLTQKHLLALQELLSSGVLDNVALIQKHLLSVQELSSAGALDNVSLTQKHLLAVQSLLSSGTLDNIELILSILLVVADLVGNGALDNIDLTQKHTLAVQSLLSAGTLDAIELILATLLVVSDLLSTGALDSTELMQKHVLTVQEVLSVGTLDIATLTQKQLLIINNLLSSGLIDKINFDIVSGLIYISLSQATEYNISLSQATEYNISLSQATEYNISLSQAGGGA